MALTDTLEGGIYNLTDRRLWPTLHIMLEKPMVNGDAPPGNQKYARHTARSKDWSNLYREYPRKSSVHNFRRPISRILSSNWSCKISIAGLVVLATKYADGKSGPTP